MTRFLRRARMALAVLSVIALTAPFPVVTTVVEPRGNSHSS
jgi:hypothetical protein